RLDQIPEKDRLDPQAVMESIAASGRPAFYEPDAAHIIEKLVPLLKAKDVVAIFSNGGVDGIHGELLEGLREEGKGPSSKHQAPEKLQIPSSKGEGVRMSSVPLLETASAMHPP